MEGVNVSLLSNLSAMWSGQSNRGGRTYTGRHYANTVQRQNVGRGRSRAKYPGRNRGVSARASMQTRGEGHVFSGYGKYAGARSFGFMPRYK